MLSDNNHSDYMTVFFSSYSAENACYVSSYDEIMLTGSKMVTLFFLV